MGGARGEFEAESRQMVSARAKFDFLAARPKFSGLSRLGSDGPQLRGTWRRVCRSTSVGLPKVARGRSAPAAGPSSAVQCVLTSVSRTPV